MKEYKKKLLKIYIYYILMLKKIPKGQTYYINKNNKISCRMARIYKSTF